MPARINLINKKFGRLLVVEKTDQISKEGGIYWKCKCECGKEINVTTHDLKKANTKSCGCLFQERRLEALKQCCADSFQGGTRLYALKQKVRVDSETQVKGVRKKHGSYQAYITLRKTRINLGTFKNINDAIIARKIAERNYFNPVLEEFEKQIIV